MRVIICLFLLIATSICVDYYEVLGNDLLIYFVSNLKGISNSATQTEIRQAYKKLALKWYDEDLFMIDL